MHSDPSTQSDDARPRIGQLKSHKIITFNGRDAATFLQGYLTCDTEKLDKLAAMPGAFTNLKGRVVANGWVWGSAEQVHMLIPETLAQLVADFLKPYLNFARTELQIDPKAPRAILVDNESDTSVPTHAVRISSYGALVGSTESELVNNDPIEETPDLSSAWLERCIDSHEVVLSQPVSSSFLPQMLGLTDAGAVAFDKGCYLGQEVVARAQHRGEVKRRLRHATLSDDFQNSGVLLPKAGSTLIDRSDPKNNKRLGTLICATRHAALIVTAFAGEGQILAAIESADSTESAAPFNLRFLKQA